MVNSEDEEEEPAVMETDPPKRKKIATLQVRGHRRCSPVRQASLTH